MSFFLLSFLLLSLFVIDERRIKHLKPKWLTRAGDAQEESPASMNFVLSFLSECLFQKEAEKFYRQVHGETICMSA